jgi:capsular polysaccharide export protein
MQLGASHFVRHDIHWLHHYFDLPGLSSTLAPAIGGIVGWGGRMATRLPQAVARFRRLPYWTLEDGFLRSVGLGKAGTLPLSIVADDLGMAIDASRPSRLESLILAAGDAASGNLGRTIREAIIANRLSKYNHLPHRAPALATGRRQRLLLVDQVVGDVSVDRALGSPSSFTRMLDDALQSGGECLVRTHPDVMAGYRKGYLTAAAASRPGVTLLSDPVSVASVLDVVDEVWTVSSQFGFDALLRGMPVRCYAAPFYAGWGLTTDHMGAAAVAAIAPRRMLSRTVDQMAAAAFVHYPVYRNPANWQPMDVFQAIELIVAEQHESDRM